MKNKTIPLLLMLQSSVVSLPDSEIYYYPHFFQENEADDILIKMLAPGLIEWKQESIQLFGKKVLTPRLSAWYGEEGTEYTYSGLTMKPIPFTPELKYIKHKLEKINPIYHFNSVLLNLYRDGQDSMGWHSDDEPELGKNPIIASVSFGAARRFVFRNTKQKQLKQEIFLQHGSLLLMKGTTQHSWQHALPKTSKATGVRINLTYRKILNRERK